jgi:putative SbcD/Mre11-related phosphoesterase
MRLPSDWLLTPERAAVHQPTATAVVADLHLGYAQVRCRHGEALPDFGVGDTRTTLQALASRAGVRRLVIAGDLLEDGRCPESLEEFLDWLPRAGIELTAVISGNHDRGFPAGAPLLPVQPEGLEVGGWRIVHGDSPLPRGRIIQGHVHPCLRWRNGVPAPCFLVGTWRIILPAFSRDAAGVNVLGVRAWQSYRCCVPAGDRVLDFGTVGVLAKKRMKDE